MVRAYGNIDGAGPYANPVQGPQTQDIHGATVTGGVIKPQRLGSFGPEPGRVSQGREARRSTSLVHSNPMSQAGNLITQNNPLECRLITELQKDQI